MTDCYGFASNQKWRLTVTLNDNLTSSGQGMQSVNIIFDRDTVECVQGARDDHFIFRSTDKEHPYRSAVYGRIDDDGCSVAFTTEGTEGERKAQVKLRLRLQGLLQQQTMIRQYMYQGYLDHQGVSSNNLADWKAGGGKYTDKE